MSNPAASISNGHSIDASVNGLHRIDRVTRSGCSTDIHPGAIGVLFLPLVSKACAISVHIKGDVAAGRNILVGDRLGGDGGWSWWFLEIVELRNFSRA